MIHIQLLNKHRLSKFIESEDYFRLPNLPISKHRALSHLKNPHLQEEDILLLLAYEEKNLVGYLGVLPDLISYNNTFTKCGWMSCLWVSEQHRGKKIAFQLIKKCFEVWGNKITITEYAAATKSLCDKTGNFHDLEIKKGIRLYIRSDLANILPPKKSFFQKTKGLLKGVDATLNAALDLRFVFYKKNKTGLNLEYINHISLEIGRFIHEKQQKQLFEKGTKELNWIIKNPWILSAPTKNDASKRYYFSSLERSFDFVSLAIRDAEHRLVAFLIFAKRNDNLRLPFCYYDKIDVVIEAIYFHLVKWKIKTFTIFHKEIVQELWNKKTPALFKKEVQRGYMISSTFKSELLKKDFEIQDGDGDCSFT